MNTRWQHIRRAAAELRAAYTAATSKHAAIELPLEDLAARLLSLSVFDDPTLPEGINGELNGQLGSIRLRPGLSQTRRRFVIAHELGHRVLEGDASLFEDNDQTLDEFADGDSESAAGVLHAYNSRERSEREANLFALELLIPADDLRHQLAQPPWNLLDLARRYSVSLDAIRSQLVNVCCIAPDVKATTPLVAPAILAPDPSQQLAVDAPLPTLVVAGPGTGKTRTIVAKYLALLKQGIEPASILALTFSNKAAEEMRDRIAGALAATRPDFAAQVDVSTFHAWGLNFLRQFGQQLDLPLDARLRSSADLYVLLRQRIAELPLALYKDLREPGMYLRQIIGAISRAKDALVSPAAFAELAYAEAERLLAEAEATQGGKTTKTAQRERDRASRNAARLRELAAIYARYVVLLREEGALDYGDLIALAVEALRIPAIAEAVRRQHQYILVDEFQDINDASGELLRLLDGGRGRLWAVGDPWQSIYRFRGASPANIRRFKHDYPGATTHDLQRNYRSLQAILDASHAVMTPDPLAAERVGLLAHRTANSGHVVEWVCADAQAEAAAIVRDILRRTRRLLPMGRYSLHTNKRILVESQHARFARSHQHRLTTARFGDHAILCRTHSQADQIAAALRSCRVPVDLAGELFDYPAVKDVLALLGMGAGEDIATLRALTMPAYALDERDISALIRFADASETPLAELVQHAGAVVGMSAAGQTRLHALALLANMLNQSPDAWHALVGYCFERETAQHEIAAALSGDRKAQHALAALGQLMVLARSYVRNVPENQRGPHAFLGYIRALIEGGERVAVVLPEANANQVRVMTVHAAKGLEFPVVYVPGVQDGVFPPRPQHGSIPPLPLFAREEDTNEERYLLYVAMTRARDQLVLTRAATKNDKVVRRSPLLPGGEHGKTAPWPIVRRRGRILQNQRDQGERLHAPPLELYPLSASALETYERCSRQFFYRYGFGLGRSEGGPYVRLIRAIRAVSDELTQRAASQSLPTSEPALREIVVQALTQYKLEGVTYYDDYAAEALAQAQTLWQELQTSAAPSNARTYPVDLPSGSVSVPIDRVEQGETGPRLVRDRNGPARENDHLSTRVALYSLVQRQHHGGTGEVALHYTATGATRVVAHKPAALDERANVIDSLLQRIANNDWTPRFGQQCATCPFVLICPV